MLSSRFGFLFNLQISSYDLSKFEQLTALGEPFVFGIEQAYKFLENLANSIILEGDETHFRGDPNLIDMEEKDKAFFAYFRKQREKNKKQHNENKDSE